MIHRSWSPSHFSRKLLCISLISLTLSSFAGQNNHLRSFFLAHPTVLKTTLGPVLSQRCMKYLGSSWTTCHAAVHVFFQQLQLKPILLQIPEISSARTTGRGTQKYLVSLADTLEKVWTLPQLDSFLKELTEKFTSLELETKNFYFIAPQLIKGFDLGELAEKRFGSRQLALQVLASLLQDLPESSVQLHFLVERFGVGPKIDLLFHILEKIANPQFYGTQGSLKLWGFSLPSPRIYHMLVPAELSSAMIQAGQSRILSFFIPFLFNYLYEISELGDDTSIVYREPALIPDLQNIEDILAGTAGAQLGLKLTQASNMNRFSIPMSKDFSEKLLRNQPANYLKFLAQSLRNCYL